jgi:hypothetical protein
MSRGRITRGIVVAAAASLLVALAPVPALGAPTSLVVPQSNAFAILGHSCGGIQEMAFGSGFDKTSGFPVGDAFLSTTCSSGGRGGPHTTYSAWVSTTWDFTGALVSDVTLHTPPTVNPTLSVFDVHKNQLYNQSNHAYLVLAPGFVPAPRPARVERDHHRDRIHRRERRQVRLDVRGELYRD